MDRAYNRKTIDCYRFFVNYGNGWEYEFTEYTRSGMKKQQKAYQKNCRYPVQIKRGREPITDTNRRFLGKFYT